MDNAVVVTIAIFAAGVIYQAGRLTVRVEKLEQWREENLRELNTIHAALRHIESLITGQET